MEAYDLLMQQGVTRLCHFTKLQSLPHILQSFEGIKATKRISQDLLNSIDPVRADGELDYVCCSIEYPNSWYLDHARERNEDIVFREWVIIYINLDILKVREAKVSECNAAKNRGQYIKVADEVNTKKLFDEHLSSFRIARPASMLSACPTNGQAEVLIKGNIPRQYMMAIAVGNEETAKIVYAMKRTLKIKGMNIYISPQVINKEWSGIVRKGDRPTEIEYVGR